MCHSHPLKAFDTTATGIMTANGTMTANVATAECFITEKGSSASQTCYKHGAVT
jgi:hypothetical protein